MSFEHTSSHTLEVSVIELVSRNCLDTVLLLEIEFEFDVIPIPHVIDGMLQPLRLLFRGKFHELKNLLHIFCAFKVIEVLQNSPMNLLDLLARTLVASCCYDMVLLL